MILGGNKRTTIGSKLHVYRLPSEKENTIELSVAQGKSMEACDPKAKGVIPHMQKKADLLFYPMLRPEITSTIFDIFLIYYKNLFQILTKSSSISGFPGVLPGVTSFSSFSNSPATLFTIASTLLSDTTCCRCMNIKTNQMREFRESEKIVYISVRVTYSTLKVTMLHLFELLIQRLS